MCYTIWFWHKLSVNGRKPKNVKLTFPSIGHSESGNIWNVNPLKAAWTQAKWGFHPLSLHFLRSALRDKTNHSEPGEPLICKSSVYHSWIRDELLESESVVHFYLFGERCTLDELAERNAGSGASAAVIALYYSLTSSSVTHTHTHTHTSLHLCCLQSWSDSWSARGAKN